MYFLWRVSRGWDRKEGTRVECASGKRVGEDGRFLGIFEVLGECST
jgi:hypothetical protein